MRCAHTNSRTNGAIWTLADAPCWRPVFIEARRSRPSFVRVYPPQGRQLPPRFAGARPAQSLAGQSLALLHPKRARRHYRLLRPAARRLPLHAAARRRRAARCRSLNRCRRGINGKCGGLA